MGGMCELLLFYLIYSIFLGGVCGKIIQILLIIVLNIYFCLGFNENKKWVWKRLFVAYISPCFFRLNIENRCFY